MNQYFYEYKKQGQLQLANKEVLLASQSPRRQELLTSLVPDFQTRTVDLDERKWSNIFMEEEGELGNLAAFLSLKKAQSIEERDKIILSGDTMVLADGQILNKPKDLREARQMLSSLFGKSHLVITGCTILLNDAYYSFSSYSKVHFIAYHPGLDQVLEDYLASKKPLDKAGAYGIQEIGHYFVQALEGDYYSIMGLPISILRQLFYQFSWFEERPNHER